jgi:hypothetical protein
MLSCDDRYCMLSCDDRCCQKQVTRQYSNCNIFVSNSVNFMQVSCK